MAKSTCRTRVDAEFRAADYQECRLPDAEILRLTGASRTTIMRWRTGKSPVPPAVLALCRLAYFGQVEQIFGDAWRDVTIGRDGRLYLPGFKYGFTTDELRAWRIEALALRRERYRADQLTADLARAQEAIEALETRLAFYQRQVKLESSMGMMLARLAT